MSLTRPAAPVTVVLGTFDPRDEGGLHALIRRFRAGDAGAFAEAADGVRRALAADPLPSPCVAVPVPDHGPGTHGGPRLALARALAPAMGWTVPEPPPLRRVTGMAPARGRTPRDTAVEVAGLAWDDAGLAPGTAVLLLDDVLASGGTLDACLAAIRRDGGHARAVRLVVLARAVTPAP